MTLLGRLSVVGASRPSGDLPVDDLLRWSAEERTLPIVCRNLGLSCDMEPAILARQVTAAHQAAEIFGRIEVLPLKGLYLAHRIYPTPALRDMGDIDLLVRRSELKGADAALKGLGYRPETDPLRLAEGGGDFLNAAIYYREEGLPVHLHWGLSNASLPHFMYGIDADEVWMQARGGEMARHHLVVCLCEHALKHSYDFLIRLTDVEMSSRGVDWPAVVDTARAWGLGRAVHYALVLIRDLMEIESPGLRHYRERDLGWDGAAFLRMARARRWNGLSAVGFLTMARGLRAKARFVREALSPPEGVGESFSSRSATCRIRRAARMAWRGLIRPSPGR